MRSPRARHALALGAALALLFALPAVPAAAAPIVEYGPVDLFPGVSFTRYKDVVFQDGANRTRRAFVLDIRPATSATIDVMMPESKLPGNEKLSVMVRERTKSIGPDSTIAYGGINGDFSWFPYESRPSHALQHDGVLWQSGQRTDANFAIRQNEARAYVNKPKTNITALAADGITPLFTVDRWNSGQPATAEIAAFSPEGGTAENPPSPPTTDFCMARIADVPNTLTWSAGKKALLQTYTVVKKRCRGDQPLGESGETILMSRRGVGTQQGKIKNLAVDQPIIMKTAMGFPGAIETIGGDPQLVDNGVTVPGLDTCGADKTNCERNPRTAVGITQGCVDGVTTCHVIWIAVDGRQGPWSAGMTLQQLADYMTTNLGVYDALNLDGGGSVGMWLKRDVLPTTPLNPCQSVAGDQNTDYGCFVNRPSTTGSTVEERVLESALVVTDGPDLYPSYEPPILGP